MFLHSITHRISGTDSATILFKNQKQRDRSSTRNGTNNNKAQFRSLFGIWNIYLKIVKHFATIAATLNEPLKNNASDSIDTLANDQKWGFYTLEQQLASPPVLPLPRAHLSYVMNTDSIVEHIWCLISPRCTQKDIQPVGYFSKKNWCTANTTTKNPRNNSLKSFGPCSCSAHIWNEHALH